MNVTHKNVSLAAGFSHLYNVCSLIERMRADMNDELRYKLLRALEQNPNLTQREMAKALGIGLGKVDFCIKALLEVGLLKTEKFKNDSKKLAHAYSYNERQGREDRANNLVFS